MSSHHNPPPSATYDAFDTITEPGRRLQPMYLRRDKTRRSKVAILASVLCVLLLIWRWRTPDARKVSFVLSQLCKRSAHDSRPLYPKLA